MMKGKVPMGVTVGVLRLLKYGSRAQLEALAQLCRDFDDPKLVIEARKRQQKTLEKAWKAGGVNEEVVLDGVLALGDLYLEIAESDDDWDECEACFQRAKEGFVRLLGEDSAKALDAAYGVASQLVSDDEEIAEYRRLWEIAIVSLPDEAITFMIANELGGRLVEKAQYEAAKPFMLTALEGRERVRGEEHKDTLVTLNNTGVLLKNMEDFAGALCHFKQALRVQEKVLGKMHPDTLGSIMNIGNMHMHRGFY